MRLLLSVLVTSTLAAGLAHAQITITPSDPSEGGAGDDINIIPEEKLSWEEAANHRDITVVKPGLNGLEVVSPESIGEADKSDLLQQRKSVIRIENQVEIIEIEEIPLEPATPEARILISEGFSKQDQERPEKD
jgi:hypothetical protein